MVRRPPSSGTASVSLGFAGHGERYPNPLGRGGAEAMPAD
jgi:hypothetical protein